MSNILGNPSRSMNLKKDKIKNKLTPRYQRCLKRNVREIRKKNAFSSYIDETLDEIELMIDLLGKNRLRFVDPKVDDVMFKLRNISNLQTDLKELFEKIKDVESNAKSPLEKILDNCFTDFENDEEVITLKEELKLNDIHIDVLGKLPPLAFEKIYKECKEDFFSNAPKFQFYSTLFVHDQNHTKFAQNMKWVVRMTLTCHNYDLFNHLYTKFQSFIVESDVITNMRLSMYHFDIQLFEFLSNIPHIKIKKEEVQKALEKCEENINPNGVRYFNNLLKQM
jgi:hypothetical protein